MHRLKVGRRVDETSPWSMPSAGRLARQRHLPAVPWTGRPCPIRRSGHPLKLRTCSTQGVHARDGHAHGACIKARLNIVISGGTGCGKTLMLNTLSSFIPHDDA